jgi:hypothetical protein
MNSHKRSTIGFLLLMALFLSALFVSSCNKSSPIPPAGSRVTSTAGKSDVFKQSAKGLQQECGRISGGCTCTLDGLPTTCALAFACLDAGFCELAKAPN